MLLYFLQTFHKVAHNLKVYIYRNNVVDLEVLYQGTIYAVGKTDVYLQGVTVVQWLECLNHPGTNHPGTNPLAAVSKLCQLVHSSIRTHLREPHGLRNCSLRWVRILLFTPEKSRWRWNEQVGQGVKCKAL